MEVSGRATGYIFLCCKLKLHLCNIHSSIAHRHILFLHRYLYIYQLIRPRETCDALVHKTVVVLVCFVIAVVATAISISSAIDC